MAYSEEARRHYQAELAGIAEAGMLKEERYIHDAQESRQHVR